MNLRTVTCTLALGLACLPALAQSNAYVRGASAPWNESTNEAAMDQAFGSGNWADLRMAAVGDTPFLPASGHRFVFLEGSDGTANELNAYLAAHRSAIEAFVTRGGCLLLNSAPNEGGDINLGFGVTLTYPAQTASVVAANPSHPIFHGPFTPVTTSYTGDDFGHAIVGPSITPVIVGAPSDSQAGQTVLGELNHGSGYVMFGGMTTHNFHEPAPEAANLRANILSHAAARCTAPQPPATARPVPASEPWGLAVLAAVLGAIAMRRRLR